MSSLRNAVKRVTHKERSQPLSRSHLGILEKKKDYKVRARDYHDKRERIRAMRSRAAMRNPDEFYFGMNRSEVRDGVHRKTREARRRELEDAIGPDAVKVMKGQDLSYVRMKRQQDARKVERLRASLHLLGAAGEGEDGGPTSVKKRRHTIFVDGEERAADFDVAEHFGTAPELAGRSFNRPRIEDLRRAAAAASADPDDDDDGGGGDGGGEERRAPTERELADRAGAARRAAKKIARARSRAYREMEARAERMAKLELAEAHLNLERLLEAKGEKRKIKDAEGGRPAVYKWKRKRAK